VFRPDSGDTSACPLGTPYFFYRGGAVRRLRDALLSKSLGLRTHSEQKWLKNRDFRKAPLGALLAWFSFTAFFFTN